MKVKKAVDPGLIHWQNLAFSGKERNCRSAVLWIVSLIMIFGSFCLILLLKNKASQQKEKVKLQECPDREVSQDLALTDYELGNK